MLFPIFAPYLLQIATDTEDPIDFRKDKAGHQPQPWQHRQRALPHCRRDVYWSFGLERGAHGPCSRRQCLSRSCPSAFCLMRVAAFASPIPSPKVARDGGGAIGQTCCQASLMKLQISGALHHHHTAACTGSKLFPTLACASRSSLLDVPCSTLVRCRLKAID